MIHLQYSIIFLLIYIVLMAPSLLLVKQTYRRILNLKAGFKGITFLPITVGSLMICIFYFWIFISISLLQFIMAWIQHCTRSLCRSSIYGHSSVFTISYLYIYSCKLL